MINILLNGCNGKMGKVVSNCITNFPQLTIAAGIDKNAQESTYPVFSNISDCTINSDIILDFSRPDSLDSLLNYSIDKKIPIIFCTTGYTDEQIAKIKKASDKIAVFHSANMSIGINVVNNILKNISRFLYNNFDVEVIEKHHNQKVDSPSGTAILLADTIKDSIPEETTYVHGRNGIAKRKHQEIGIHSIRGGSIVGEHDILFAGQGETIELKHTALSREVFAIGALKACEFMSGKHNGLYSMDDIISQ
ncbi:4-hydroxy-tetrahydrodipicolinate reductase [Clostridium fermenticellae]|uniref:4-hydroxy-tetrahydrodipicolinate reductase n=1 Tax=Clostridium fermenticellae TaxID=2068654 RepID=A0A386H274_9CLOT|nr:4-hydroxy-tetrahydrodipicolinate reductase [Clostridium fermenticellae]AYD39766.1 4-hydroxy-tetrahydrodipicolinate reductase [Clostridium fermenticellae]